MANNFVFTSPGVKFRERDLSFVVRNVGITNLGLVGETQKGPAFETVFIKDKEEFRTRFGFQSIEKFPDGTLRYHLPYNGNAYLEESSQLYVTRVLGLSGYDAGTAWAITLSAGVDPSTTGDTSTTSVVTGYTGTSSFLGVTITAAGQTGSVFTGFTKAAAPSTSFSGVRQDFVVDTYSATGYSLTYTATTVSGTSYTAYENMVLAIVRSRATITDVVDGVPVTTFDATDITITSNDTIDGVGDLFGQFTLRASSGSSTEDSIVSLSPNVREYLPNVIGDKPKGKNNKIYVEAIYPDLIKKLDDDGIGYGVNTTIIDATSDGFTNYEEQYQTPETPWVVSELRGSEIERLFKFISISDGDDANQEIKISITNIDPVSKEFDILIRDFNDTDDNIVILESFRRCTMQQQLTNFVGARVGTSDSEYDLQSSYVMLELDTDFSQDAFPAGFEGYNQKDWAASATSDVSSVNGVAPKIFYKTSYDTDDKLTRTYLGVSERGYDGVSVAGTGVDQNQYNYLGQSAFVKSNGFHMDSGATGTYLDGTNLIGQFDTGAARFRTSADISDSSNPYSEANARKFTVVPAGGFDGWNEHRNSRSNTDLYKQGGIYDGVADGVTPDTDYVAWLTAIRTFANPEEVTINLFGTPGLNWSDNLGLVNESLDMIEDERTDALYIVDAPDIDSPLTAGSTRQDVVVANDIVDLFDVATLDSSYAATYYPWVQIRDTDNNVNVWLPPTGEVFKAMAFTDNTKFSWFAPAGLQRGVTDARKSKYKMSLEARDILYDGRINPMADFTGVGTAIFGQKTMQVRESALDRINVRRLLLQLKVLIANIAIRLVFEQNDQTTIDQFLAKANPVLDAVRRERGVEEFRIKMDESINNNETRDRNELYGEIFIKPTRAVEYIGITFTITPSGANFDDI